MKRYKVLPDFYDGELRYGIYRDDKFLFLACNREEAYWYLENPEEIEKTYKNGNMFLIGCLVFLVISFTYLAIYYP